MIDESMLDVVKGKQDHQTYNRRNCLEGIQLNTLKSKYKLFQAGVINGPQFIVQASIAYNLHRHIIGPQIDEAMLEATEKAQKAKKIVPEFDPQKWNSQDPRELLMTSAQQLIDTLGKAVQLANVKAST